MVQFSLTVSFIVRLKIFPISKIFQLKGCKILIPFVVGTPKFGTNYRLMLNQAQHFLKDEALPMHQIKISSVEAKEIF